MRYAVAIVIDAWCWVMALLGQAAADPLSGGAGWIGAGLLGLVLGWLLIIHLPAKDKQLKELLDTFTAATAQSQTAFSERNDKTLDTFALLTREERQIYQRWHEENRAILERLVGEMRDNRHGLANLRHELGLKKMADKLKEEEGA